MLQAVITGDLIDSTKLPPAAVALLFEKLERTVKTIPATSGLQLEIYRGDGFQCQVKNAGHGLRTALLLKTFFRSYPVGIPANQVRKKNGATTPRHIMDARMALSVGPVENQTKRLATSNGMAFQLSGRLLDQLKGSRQHFTIGSSDQFNAEWQTESILLDALLARTSPQQCQVIYAKLNGRTETEIATSLQIGQSAVNQRAASGNWHAINAMLERFEEVYRHA